MPKERKLPLYGLLPLLTMPATGVRQVRTITFCFLYSTIIPNLPLPVKGEIAFLSPYFFRAPESAFFSSAAPCKGQAYGPQAAPAAPGQTGSARFGGSAAGPAARTFPPAPCGYSATFTACPRWKEYSTASVTGRPSCRRTIAADSRSCRAERSVSSPGSVTRSVL